MLTAVRAVGDSVISSREGTVSTTREGFIGWMVTSDSAGTAGIEVALDADLTDIDSVAIDSTRGGAGGGDRGNGRRLRFWCRYFF